MDSIYMLNHEYNRKEEGELIGQEGDDLFNINIEKKIRNNQYHYHLRKSFNHCTIKPGDKPLKALIKYGAIYSNSNHSLKDFFLKKLVNIPGAYSPRIYRPFMKNMESPSYLEKQEIDVLKKEVFQLPDYLPHDDKILLTGINQLAILKELLLSILNNIYPESANLRTYGHSIKNLLVLSCIEVETQLKGIYKANETHSKLLYTTKDYFKLKKIMQLDKYEVRLPYYPSLKVYTPFKKWTETNPTQSINWYNSYNAVKHNSELEFNKATLDHAISAICAVAILIKAQYGVYIPFWKEDIGSFFDITDKIKWSIEQKILPPFINENWIETRIGL